ncbi:MAG: aminotransferase class I/II-fold pyridoxal phosphate-dependent enzyme [bacterium]|nr:aminotransferase class I/II-fold pyridoxal phosphate-dependent enzyme [bacterium]
MSTLEKHKIKQKSRKKNDKNTNILDIAPQFINFKDFPLYVALKEQLNNLEAFGLKNPFFTEHEGLVLDTTKVHGQTLINFSNYNYIGMAGHPEVSDAAKKAIDLYGTSVSASRLVSGERPLHVSLEKKIADWIGVDDSIVYVSGHSTNVSTIGHLFEKGDLIVYDSLSHNSIQMGCKLSDAKAIPFPHNDYLSLDQILQKHRQQYNRVLIVIEGVYSMDGDIPDLNKYVEIKKRHKAFLMVDEAHSIGVLGRNGRGLAEHADVSPRDVDLWMGTLSKSFASCGGYIAGCKELIDYLRYSSPAFVYSVGLSPPNAAASLKAIEILESEPDRVEKLKNNSAFFLRLCKENKLDTGLSKDSPIIPIIVRNSMKCLMLSERLLKSGINVLPIIYPAVEDHLSRLRFFITSCHHENQIKETVKTLTKEISACASL